jgi:CheY-like chemotaxis protein
MFTFGWVFGTPVSFFAVIIGLAIGIALIVAVIHRYIRPGSPDRYEHAYGAGSAAESAETDRRKRIVGAEESSRDPLGWSAATDKSKPADSLSQSTEEYCAPLGKGKTILIADDDPVVVFALSRRLQQLGFQVIRSPDATHALMGAMKTKPDLIILDVNMPSGNGLAVCEMMASDPRYAKIPIIIHSVLSDEATLKRCGQLGARHVEKSPRSWARIKLLVETLIGKGGGEVDPMEFMPQSAGDMPREQSATEPAEELTQSQPASVEQPTDGVFTNRPSPEKPGSAMPTESPDILPEPIAAACGHGRILCIDGPRGELQLLENRLSSLGVEVNRISDLDEGFWACFTEKPHVVVIQSVSSGNNLNDTLHRFVEHPLTRNFPVIFINQDNAIPAEELPVAANFKVLQSPIVWRELLRELEKIIPIADRQDSDPLARAERSGAETGRADEQAEGTSDQASPAAVEKNAFLRILCIDDDPVITKSIAVRLKRYGIEVKGAENGTAGYLQAVSEQPDLILLDIGMPNGDGHYVLGKLKEHSRTKDIPIVMLTAETHPGVRRQMLGLGASGYLSKPVRWGEMFEELGRHVALPKPLILDYKLSEDQLVSV